MTYLRKALGDGPFFPGGLPGPVPPPPGGVVPGPTMPANIFPTQGLRWGDVVNITGPFQSLFQGQIRVKFSGAPWQAPAIQGPFSASLIVPDGARTGECAIEINGRRAFGTQCGITPASTTNGQVVRPGEHKDIQSWKDFGEKSRMDGDDYMGTYVVGSQSRGIGAVAAHDLGATAFVGGAYSPPRSNAGRIKPKTAKPSSSLSSIAKRQLDILIRALPAKKPTTKAPSAAMWGLKRFSIGGKPARQYGRRKTDLVPPHLRRPVPVIERPPKPAVKVAPKAPPTAPKPSVVLVPRSPGHALPDVAKPPVTPKPQPRHAQTGVTPRVQRVSSPIPRVEAAKKAHDAAAERQYDELVTFAPSDKALVAEARPDHTKLLIVGGIALAALVLLRK